MTAPSDLTWDDSDPRVVRALEEYAAEVDAGRAPGRNDFLARDPEVAGEVAACLDALDLLRAAVTTPETAAPLPQAELAAPLGDFRLVREVGRGGMGVVYEARQLSLGRRVALKVLPFAGALDERQLRRFRNEAQAAAQLHHPHIVPVYAVGCERGVHFYAMQFIEGRSLAAALAELRRRADPPPGAILRGGPAETHPAAGLPTEGGPQGPGYFAAVARLGIQAAEALEYAHQMGVVHRDVKPANLLLDAAGHLWVTDFGLARVAGEAGLTLTGDVMGTLRYASPEQALGRPARLDHRADVYALGATLYELLTLEPAFPGSDQAALLRQIAHEEPRPPRRLNRAVPAELETVVLKALEKDPADRYATAQELADDLRRFLEDRPVRARRPTLRQRAAKWARRHRAGVATAAGVLLLLAAVAAGAGWLLHEERVRGARTEAKSAALRAELEERARAQAEVALYFRTIQLAEREVGARRVRERLEECPAGLRHWEWHYLMRSRRDNGRVVAHPTHLCCAARGPDGRLLAVGDTRGVVTVWDARTWQQVRELPAHRGWARGVAFSPDGRRLATAGFDGRVRAWDVETGRLLWDRPQGAEAYCVAFHPGGRLLASGGERGDVKFWDADTGQQRGALEGHRRNVFCLAFSPGGGELAAGSADGTASVWQVESRQKLHTLPGDGAYVLGVAFSPDGRLLATASGGFYTEEHRGGLTLWDAATGAPWRRLCGPRESFWSVTFSPDGRRLAAGASEDSTVKLWDVESAMEALTLRGHTEAVWAVVFSPDGHRLLSASGDRTVRVWDASPLPEGGGPGPRTLARLPEGVLGVAHHPGGARLAAACLDGNVVVWDIAAGRAAQVLVAPGACGVAFSRDGTRLAGSAGRDVLVWDAESGRELLRLRTGEVVTGVAFRPDGRAVAAAAGTAVRLWDEAGNLLRPPLRGHRDFLSAVAFSPDGSLLASADYGGGVRVWDARSGAAVGEFAAHAGRAACVAFSPDGKRLVSAGADGGVCAWDTQTWERERWPGPVVRTQAVAFSPDGRRLVAACADGALRFWDVAAGRQFAARPGHDDTICGVAFSPDGRRIVSGSLDRTLALWDADPDGPGPAALP
jgi:WD40 repeat protein